MKRLICGIFAGLLVIAASGCGAQQGKPEQISYDSQKTDGKEDKTVVLEEPVVLLEDAYARVELIAVFQENHYWADGGDAFEKGMTLRITNKHDKRIHVGFKDLYIGDNLVTLCQTGGSVTPIPGKTVSTGFYIWQMVTHEHTPLNDLNEVYDLEGTIEIEEYVEENVRKDVSSQPFSFKQ